MSHDQRHVRGTDARVARRYALQGVRLAARERQTFLVSITEYSDTVFEFYFVIWKPNTTVVKPVYPVKCKLFIVITDSKICVFDGSLCIAESVPFVTRCPY